LHVWLLSIVGALTAPTFMALARRWRSRPQHQKRTWKALQRPDFGQKYRVRFHSIGGTFLEKS
jgi:hypothetical protein